MFVEKRKGVFWEAERFDDDPRGFDAIRDIDLSVKV
jgi:hypothetical protein